MTKQDKIFQPGTILHEVIVGAFRSSGSSFEAWCRTNDVKPSTARTATYGQAGGEVGSAMLERIIDAAGREMIEMAYSKRVIREAAKLENARGGA
ncbi:hypothetical protein ACFP4H_16905 [Pseudophaeobacter arcticus]|uniref:hypothetical protein n=1 Tax=Pseudophaeobacter arcticus TaxID=385492 RepID=UPI00047FCE79|nr:hypothetical protein [Pseudophaeobacter arcticus]